MLHHESRISLPPFTIALLIFMTLTSSTYASPASVLTPFKNRVLTLNRPLCYLYISSSETHRCNNEWNLRDQKGRYFTRLFGVFGKFTVSPNDDGLRLLTTGSNVRMTSYKVKKKEIQIDLRDLKRGYQTKLYITHGKMRALSRVQLIAILSRYFREFEAIHNYSRDKTRLDQLIQTLQTSKDPLKAWEAGQKAYETVQELMVRCTDTPGLGNCAVTLQKDLQVIQTRLKTLRPAVEKAQKTFIQNQIKTLNHQYQAAVKQRETILSQWQGKASNPSISLQKLQSLHHSFQTLTLTLDHIETKLRSYQAAPDPALMKQRRQQDQRAKRLIQLLRSIEREQKIKRLDAEYLTLQQQYEQLLNEYTLAYGTPAAKMVARRFVMLLRKMILNREQARDLGSQKAAEQLKHLRSDLETVITSS